MMHQLTDILELPGGSAGVFQLIQWKSAIKLEKLGLKHSRGSVRRHAAMILGLKPTAKHDEVIGVIENILSS